MAQTAFHFSSNLLAPGSVILPGNWGRVLRKAGRRHNLWARENALEGIRQNEFPSAQSRLDSAYFFETMDEAVAYAHADISRYAIMLLYQIELLEPDAPRSHADWNAIPSNDDPTNMDRCRAYWRGDTVGVANRRETLAVTAMKIIRPIDCPAPPNWPRD